MLMLMLFTLIDLMLPLMPMLPLSRPPATPDDAVATLRLLMLFQMLFDTLDMMPATRRFFLFAITTLSLDSLRLPPYAIDATCRRARRHSSRCRHDFRFFAADAYICFAPLLMPRYVYVYMRH